MCHSECRAGEAKRGRRGEPIHVSNEFLFGALVLEYTGLRCTFVFFLRVIYCCFWG
jgi:hypothetical protein